MTRKVHTWWVIDLLIGVAAAGLLFVYGGGAANAATCPTGATCNVTATVTVPSSITISGLSNSINFGSTIGGTPITVTAAEQYTVTTNDSNGYTLQVTPAVQPIPGDEAFCAQDNQCFPLYGNLSVTETTSNGTSIGLDDWAQYPTPQASQTINVTHLENVSPDSYSENWTLTVPANQEGGNYSESFEYAATGN